MDLTLVLAGNTVDLQGMLDVVSNWCHKCWLCINEEKTKIVHYRQPFANQCNVQCGMFNDIYADTYKYSGLCFHQFLDFKKCVEEIAKSASRALGVLICKSKAIGGMFYATFTKL